MRVDRAVEELLAVLAVERGASRHTVSAYRRDLRRWVEHLARGDVHDLDRVRDVDVRAFVAVLVEGDEAHGPLATSSAARALAAVRTLHRTALQQGWTALDPSADVERPATPRRLPRALPVEQVLALLATPVEAAAAGDPVALRDAALLEVLYGSGARVAEVCGADVDDVDLTAGGPAGGGAVRVHGKGGRQRVVPLGRHAVAAVEDWLRRGRPQLAARAPATGRGRAGPALLLGARGGRLSRSSAFVVLKQRAAEAGLDAARVSPHVLRHSCATHLLDGGADVRVVQEVLGHASVATTQTYTLVTPQRLREVHAAAHPRARVGR